MSKHLPRPYRLCFSMMLLAIILLALPFQTASAPVIVRPDLLVFDIFYGVSGFIMMGYTSIWLWRGVRGWRTNAGTLTAVTVLFGVSVIRSTVFAQTDYERGRLAWAASVLLCFMMLSVGGWWASTNLRD